MSAPKSTTRRITEYVLGTIVLGGVVAGIARAILSNWFQSLRWIWALVVAVGVVAAVFVYQEFSDRFFDRARFQWQSAKWAGVAQVYPVAPYPGLGMSLPDADIREKGYSALVAATASARDLKLLMVSGWRFIGCQSSPGLLLKALQETRAGFNLQVLLWNPDTDGSKQRAEKQGFAPGQYADGVRAVVWTIAQLRQHGYPVSAYYYNEDPIWQMVITELELWLLCATARVATGESPIYCLKKVEHGLAFGMQAVWERRMAGAIPIDLDAAVQPNWKTLKAYPARLEKTG